MVPERNKEIIVPEVDMSAIPDLNPEIFNAMGREAILRMIEDFYIALSGSAIAHMFPSGNKLVPASRKSAAFFVQLLGGPPEYSEKFGPPMMRRRHFPFEISEVERQIWIQVFFSILDNAPQKYGFPVEHLETFKTFLDGFSRWMVNCE